MLTNIQPAIQSVKDMVAAYEAISLQMGEPGADLDGLSAKMDRLQVRTPRGAACLGMTDRVSQIWK